MIRAAHYQDIPAILSLGLEAWQESRFSEAGTIDEQSAKGVLYGLISGAGGNVAVLVSQNVDGVIIGGVTPLYEVTDVPVLTHHLWYVAPGARPGLAMALLDALHEWAGPVLKRHLVHDAIVDPEKSRKLFERRGYRLAGYLYEKED